MPMTLVNLVGGTGDVGLCDFVRHVDVLQTLCLWPATYYLVLLQLIPTRSPVAVETTIKERQTATQEGKRVTDKVHRLLKI